MKKAIIFCTSITLLLLASCDLFDDYREFEKALDKLPGTWQIQKVYYNLGTTDSVVTSGFDEMYFPEGCGMHDGSMSMTQICEGAWLLMDNGNLYPFEFQLVGNKEGADNLNLYFEDDENPMGIYVAGIGFSIDKDDMVIEYSQRLPASTSVPYRMELRRTR